MSPDDTEPFFADFKQDTIVLLPRVLLVSDNIRGTDLLQQCLADAGLDVHLAQGYPELESSWRQDYYTMVLLSVNHLQSVEAAVEAAISIKRRDPLQFVGYLADPSLWTSGLAGDAIFPRSLRLLPGALRSHLESRRNDA